MVNGSTYAWCARGTPSTTHKSGIFADTRHAGAKIIAVGMAAVGAGAMRKIPLALSIVAAVAGGRHALAEDCTFFFAGQSRLKASLRPSQMKSPPTQRLNHVEKTPCRATAPLVRPLSLWKRARVRASQDGRGARRTSSVEASR